MVWIIAKDVIREVHRIGLDERVVRVVDAVLALRRGKK